MSGLQRTRQIGLVSHNIWFLFHFMDSLPGSDLSVISRIDMHILQSFSQDYFPQTRFYETLLFSPVLHRYTSKLYFIIHPKQDSRVKYIWELLQYYLSLLQHHTTYWHSKESDKYFIKVLLSFMSIHLFEFRTHFKIEHLWIMLLGTHSFVYLERENDPFVCFVDFICW